MSPIRKRTLRGIDALFHALRHPVVHTILIFSLLTYIGGLFYIQNETITCRDPLPTLLPVSKSCSLIATEVTAGLHVNSFSQFSFEKNEFCMDAIVWFTFPVGSESLKTVEEFSFQNGRITSKSLPTIKVIDDIVMMSFQTVVEFKTHVSHADYPFGVHRLTLCLENRRVTPNELCFTSSIDLFELAEDIVTPNWRPLNETQTATTGAVRSFLHEKNTAYDITYPAVLFTIEFASASTRDLMGLYFPLIILFLICLFALLVDIREDALRTNIIIGALPTLVLFRLVINTTAPAATGMAKVDALYYILVCLSLIILLFQVYVLLVKRTVSHLKSDDDGRASHMEILDRCNSAVFIGVVIILVVALALTHPIPLFT